MAGLATRMPGFPNAEAVLRVLNGLPPGAEPADGQLLKYIGY